MIILPLIFFILLNLQSVFSTSNHSLLFGYSFRGDKDYGKYQYSLHNLLGTLSSPTSKNGYSNMSTIFPKTPHELHGLYLCRGDVDPQTCRSCINYAKNTLLEKYPYGREGLVWYNHCMLRYSNVSFFGKLDANTLTFRYAVSDNSKIKGNYIKFMMVLSNMMKGLAIKASNDRNENRFASDVVTFARFDSLYAMAQCTTDLVASDCFRCLSNANRKLLSMKGSTSGEVFHYSCMVQYKTTFASDKNKVNSLPSVAPTQVTNSTLIRLRVQFGTIPQSNNSTPTLAITNSTRIRFKVQVDTSPSSNTTLVTSSTSCWAIDNSTTIRVKGTLLDDADRTDQSKKWDSI
ncbi:hypothetical protein BVRB_9g212390 [Beta vulgaris subsp. vulgaris]|nr:hypothetical protein BVRB_9g212390 [Beta vulgaris subsp. vulgaris]